MAARIIRRKARLRLMSSATFAIREPVQSPLRDWRPARQYAVHQIIMIVAKANSAAWRRAPLRCTLKLKASMMVPAIIIYAIVDSLAAVVMVMING